MLRGHPPKGHIEMVGDDHEFVVPEKMVKSPTDMALWEKSEAYHEYLGFLLALNDAIQGKSNSTKCSESPTVPKIVDLLEAIDKLIDETPPIQQPQRFGNSAFRIWHGKLSTQAITMLQKALPNSLHRAIPELTVYLLEGFGNTTRIDYGTGHEMSFAMFLCCLFKIGALQETDKEVVVFKIFNKYLKICRKLQKSYRMEPAGSHGVWSLDDYQFIPFVWGSSQLVAHPKFEPTSFLNDEIVKNNADDYLFMSCIKYINEVKIGPFAEHSNQLWGVSGVSSWSKVNSGLVKMYKVEILGKFPVVQHIHFGSLLSFKTMKRGPGSRNIQTDKPATVLRPSMAPPTFSAPQVNQPPDLLK